MASVHANVESHIDRKGKSNGYMPLKCADNDKHTSEGFADNFMYFDVGCDNSDWVVRRGILLHKDDILPDLSTSVSSTQTTDNRLRKNKKKFDHEIRRTRVHRHRKLRYTV
jgi:hypothetical protein